MKYVLLVQLGALRFLRAVLRMPWLALWQALSIASLVYVDQELVAVSTAAATVGMFALIEVFRERRAEMVVTEEELDRFNAAVTRNNAIVAVGQKFLDLNVEHVEEWATWGNDEKDDWRRRVAEARDEKALLSVELGIDPWREKK